MVAAGMGDARTSSSTNVVTGLATAGAVRHSNRDPSATSQENGTRNFSEAAVHSQ